MRDVDPASIKPIAGRRHLLVLDTPEGGLAGAAVLVIEGDRGHLSLLTIAPELVGHGLEDRFIGVIEAMCKAFGAKGLDIPARRAA